MNRAYSEESVRRMIHKVVGSGVFARVENIVAVLCVLVIGVLLVHVFMPGGLLAAEFTFVVLLLVVINLIPLALVLVRRRRRSAQLLDLVLPADRCGRRAIDKGAYQMLAAEYRAIEEAEFRKALAKAFKKAR